jgi:hypothetical protein
MKTRIFNTLIILVACILSSGHLKAQLLAESVEGNFAISYTVNQINQYISRHEPDIKGQALYDRLAFDRFFVRGDSILVSLQINDQNEFETVQQMNRRGAKLNQVLEGDIYFAGFVHIDSLLRFPDIFRNSTLQLSLLYDIPTNDTQGPERINSNTYETGGANPNAGNGRTIAILDSGWGAYNFAMNDGLVPSAFTYYNCETGTCVVATIPGGGGGVGHGTMSVQTVFHHAPAATYRIYNTPNNQARAAAIQHAASIGVHVITCSQSGYNTGWNDNSGILCAAVNASAANGIVMFFSAGNRNGTGATGENGSHWQGNFNNDGNNFHRWAGNDIVNNRTTAVGNNNSFHVNIQCNNDGGGSTLRYEIQIINTANNTVLASSQFAQSTTVNWNNFTGSARNVGIRLRSLTSVRPAFEMWTHNEGQYQYFSTENQTSSPGNCTNNPRLFAVAAVHQANYNQANPNAMWYSSRGPTNQNNNSVTIAGPTITNVADYTGGGTQFTITYGGTSAATPNVAGAATALWSKHTGLTANHVRDILIWKAYNYKDWGTAGYDNVFGWGGAFLFTYNPTNIYLNQTTGSSGVAPSNGIYPWYSLKDIHNMALNNRNVIMLTHDTDTPPFVISKNMTINAAANSNASLRVE